MFCRHLECRNQKGRSCDYVEWINGTTEKTDEDCPSAEKSSSSLQLMPVEEWKMLNCSWDSAARKATGCTYIEWLKPNVVKEEDSGGEEFLPQNLKETK